MLVRSPQLQNSCVIYLFFFTSLFCLEAEEVVAEKQQFPSGRTIQADGEQLHQSSRLVRYMTIKASNWFRLENGLLWHSG